MPSMLLAEGKSLDVLITFVALFFLSWTLPGLVGLYLCRLGQSAWQAAFGLGLISVLGGAAFLGFLVSERGTALGFYLAAGTPLLVGIGVCLLAWRASRQPSPPS